MKPKLILKYNCGLFWQLPDGPIVKCTIKLYLFPEMRFKALLCNDRKTASRMSELQATKG